MSARAPQSRRGFSLVELLVVIGIIALLLGLLMPALSRAREQKDLVVCLKNLQTMGEAGALHASDHNGYLPPAGWHWNAVGGVVNPDGLEDPGETKYLYYDDNGIRRPLPMTASLSIVLGQHLRTDSRENLQADLQQESVKKQFRCPSQSLELPGWTQRGDDGGTWICATEISSYIFNEAFLGRHPGADHGPRGKLSKVAHSSQVFFAMDGRPRDSVYEACYLIFAFGPTDSVQDFQDKNLTTILGKEALDFYRHQQRVNAFFLDGHAESFSMDRGGLGKIGVSNGLTD